MTEKANFNNFDAWCIFSFVEIFRGLLPPLSPPHGAVTEGKVYKTGLLHS